MKSKLIYPMVLVLFATACGGRNGARGTAAQQQYETVQEGSAAGVTSTIHGPGETLPPITGTNADTTTDFALNPGAVPPPQPQATVGGLPPMQAYPSSVPPMSPLPTAVARPSSTTPTPVARQASPQPQPQAEPQPTQPQPAEPTAGPAENEPATDTATTAPPAQTNTTATAPPAPLDLEVGAGTMHPETFLRVLGPEPLERRLRAAVAPARRRPLRREPEPPLQAPPVPGHPQAVARRVQQLYLEPRGVRHRPAQHDIRFEEDNWESPTLGAWGIGWQVLLDGMEITQFTYFQQAGGIDLAPISAEITYGSSG
jgi:hypothetical protein